MVQMKSKYGVGVRTIALVLGFVACQPETNEGCNGGGGPDFTNDVDPTEETPAILTEDGVWETRWDNPVVTGLVDLPRGEVQGFAERKGNAWTYGKFDLEAAVRTPGPFQYAESIFTWPASEGFYGDDELRFFWQAHGTRLQPDTSGPSFGDTTVQAMVDYHNTGEQPHLREGRFRLAPDVLVVPITAVVFHTSGRPNYPPGWVSREDVELLIDDRWRGEKKITTNPSFSPERVDTVWTHKPGCRGKEGCETRVGDGSFREASMSQPDRIFDQCGIQFRLVKYKQCEVPPGVFDRSGTDANGNNQCGLSQHQFTLDNALSECGIEAGDSTTKVVFLENLVERDCPDWAIAAAGSRKVYLSQFAINTGAYALSHELGHTLSLGHANGFDQVATCDSLLSVDEANLMCAANPAGGRVLTPAQCEIARSNLTNDYWTGQN